MTDDDFLLEFETCTLAKTHFNHQGHLRICWIYLSRHSFFDAKRLILQGILKFATSLGAQHIFHITLTETWIYLVHSAIQHQPDANTFADFIAKNQQLLDKSLPFQYYSKSLLESEKARQSWVEPDLKPLPNR